MNLEKAAVICYLCTIVKCPTCEQLTQVKCKQFLREAEKGRINLAPLISLCTACPRDRTKIYDWYVQQFPKTEIVVRMEIPQEVNICHRCLQSIQSESADQKGGENAL